MIGSHRLRPVKRLLESGYLCYCTTMQSKDVVFPVPWGHVAAKAWGDPLGKPVLALHGWLDNAGSFDKLVPLLSGELYVVAVDLPGHGKSSHRPTGTRYNSFDYIADIKYVVDALKWDQFSILAHSLGGAIASWFAGALPDRVETLILLESLGFFPRPIEEIPKMMGQALNTLSHFDQVENKSYPSLDLILDRMVEGHVSLDKLFDRECAQILAKRGTHQLEDGCYQLTRDLRVKQKSLLSITQEMNREFFKAIKCPLLLIIGETKFSESWGQGFNIETNMKIVQVPGGHHLHLYNADQIKDLVNSFLLHQSVPPQFKEFSKL